MITKVPEQEWFFYDVKWNKARDSMLLRRLISRRAECHPTPPVDSLHALICAMESINTELDADLSYVNVQMRVTHLKKRLSTFTRMIGLPGIQWDTSSSNNVLLAMDDVWQRLFKEDHFTQAYFYEVEPEYHAMCQLFAFDAVKEESVTKTVILITDTTVSKKQVRHILSPSFLDDEVTSPVVKPPAARKLFDDDAASSYTPVGYSKVGKYFVSCPSIENKMRLPSENEGNVKKDGACASSCASSSPFK